MKGLYYIAFVASLAYRSLEQLVVDMCVLDIAAGWRKTAAANIAKVVANLDTWKTPIKDNDPEGYLTTARVENVYTELARLYTSASAVSPLSAVEGEGTKRGEDTELVPPPETVRICAACGKFFRLTRGGAVAGEEATNEDTGETCIACASSVRS